MQKYGEVSWGDVPSENVPNRENRDSFLRLEKGSNVLRVITSPFQYTVHRYKKEGDVGFGQRVMCSAANGSCSLCALGDKAKRRWLLGVVDRKTKAYKILDIGISVFKAIQQLTRDDEWGEPIKYDIDIKVDPNGGATNYYNVMPKIPKPLSADDIQIKDMLDVEELKRRCLPPTPDKVQERLDKILNGTPARASAPTTATSTMTRAPLPAPAKVATVDTSSSDDDEEEDLSFPKYGQ